MELLAILNPVADDLQAAIGDNALRVELHALHVWQPLVADSHHQPIVTPHRHLQLIVRKDIIAIECATVAVSLDAALDHEAVVPRSLEGIRQTL